MSFDFNMVGSNFKPKVENTFLGKGGGGGNTGYFQQQRKKKDEDNSILSKMLNEDILDKTFSKEIPELENDQGFLDKVKGFLGKLK
jgi:hypothetical protein